jgi:hypothetical protein
MKRRAARKNATSCEYVESKASSMLVVRLNEPLVFQY